MQTFGIHAPISSETLVALPSIGCELALSAFKKRTYYDSWGSIQIFSGSRTTFS